MQGSGGTYTFTDDGVQYIAHVNADTITKPGGWSRTTSANTRDKIKAEVRQRLDHEQTKSEWGPVTQIMRESLVMVCSRFEETSSLVGDAVAAAAQEWLGIEEMKAPHKNESFIIRHPNEDLCLFEEQPSNRRWFMVDEAANSDWGILVRDN
ncbi:hypothetical protein KC336_g18324 [Hortaea werneckii]|nr:hypothetical protein KC336_g18324 [Hortaea werneckii]